MPKRMRFLRPGGGRVVTVFDTRQPDLRTRKARRKSVAAEAVH